MVTKENIRKDKISILELQSTKESRNTMEINLVVYNRSYQNMADPLTNIFKNSNIELYMEKKILLSKIREEIEKSKK